MLKTCFKCAQTKSLSDFYKHTAMLDGHLNKCKECTKRDVRERYRVVGGRAEYERKRSLSPARKAAVARYQRALRSAQPEKYAARAAVSNALRDGRLIRMSCSICGTAERVQAHHHDYSKPLDVE